MKINFIILRISFDARDLEEHIASLIPYTYSIYFHTQMIYDRFFYVE